MVQKNGGTPETVGAAAADRAIESEPKPLDRIALSNGIVLRVKPVSPLLLRRATIHVADPKVPVVMIEEKGREEENPNDPDYLTAVADARTARGFAAMNVVLATGLAVESIPDGIPRPADDSWLEMLEAAEIEADVATSAKRFRLWCEVVALITPEDFEQVSLVALRLMGLTEEEVSQAVESFRSPEGRGVDPALPAPAHAPDGDRVPAAPRGGRRRDRRA